MSFPPTDYGADSPQLSYAQVEGYWIAAGGPPVLAAIMAAIADAESGLRPARVQESEPYQTTGWGLWQITPGNSVPQVGIDQSLLYPEMNAKAAVIKWRGQGLGAWTTWSTGAYRRYLQIDVPPVLPGPAVVASEPMASIAFDQDGKVHIAYVAANGHVIELVEDGRHTDSYSIYDQTQAVINSGQDNELAAT